MLWTDLEGRELPGGWRMRRLMRPEGRNAWFEATGPDGKPAIVSLTETLNDEDELLARLRAAAAIRHPNVVAVCDARLVWMNDTPVVMAAMEPTEENLAEVLRERALEPAEARLLLNALLQGLAAIHARRLTHGRIVAGSVLAMGDTVKLRSDCLHLEGFAAGAAEDMRGVGRIVTQALTRRIPAHENDPVLQLVPEPMGRAVRRALSGNATVEEVAALAGVRLVKVTEPAAPRNFIDARRIAGDAVAGMRKPEESKENAEEPGPAAEKQAAATVAAIRPAEMAADPQAAAAQMDLPLVLRWKEEPETKDEDEEEIGSHEELLRRLLGRIEGLPGRLLDGTRRLLGRWNYHRRGAPWVIGAAVGLMLATILMLHSWLHGGPAARSAAHDPKVVVEGATPALATAPVARQAGATRVWRVVVYTYRQRKEATQRARELAQRYPGLRPGVMATRGGDFLVTVGGTMSRVEAMALRSRAVRMGLPGDTYAQNFHSPAA
jgi:eukaryotic-like serine/threonine-protein kinase